MAIKKELAVLYTALMAKAKMLPPRVQNRTLDDIDALFQGHERIDNQTLLNDILSKAQTKLSILEMSLSPPPPPPSKSDPGKTTYTVQGGHAQPGSAPTKETIEFSNWYAGNVDPAELRKHKELLERQHFEGPFWEGRKRNPSILDEPQIYQNVKPEPRPPESLRKQKEASFEEVKR